MTETPDLAAIYRDYIACLNRQDWSRLGDFVAENVCHNDRHFGLAGYKAMLVEDFDTIPDLRFTIDLLVADSSYVASRLWFDCRPKGIFLGLAVNGRRVTFCENVIYRFAHGRIDRVWSVVDKGAVERQIPS